MFIKGDKMPNSEMVNVSEAFRQVREAMNINPELYSSNELISMAEQKLIRSANSLTKSSDSDDLKKIRKKLRKFSILLIEILVLTDMAKVEGSKDSIVNSPSSPAIKLKIKNKKAPGLQQKTKLQKNIDLQEKIGVQKKNDLQKKVEAGEFITLRDVIEILLCDFMNLVPFISKIVDINNHPQGIDIASRLLSFRFSIERLLELMDGADREISGKANH